MSGWEAARDHKGQRTGSRGKERGEKCFAVELRKKKLGCRGDKMDMSLRPEGLKEHTKRLVDQRSAESEAPDERF